MGSQVSPRRKVGGTAIKVQNLTRAALFAALIALCAWLSLPVAEVAVTLQTFGIFLALFVLGGKWGSVSILVYLLLGLAGAPVFAAFQGGIGTLVGITGGYLWGFLLTGLSYWAFEKLCKPVGVILGVLACYLCGSIWFCLYVDCQVGIYAAFAKCVLPYLIPDGVKLFLAWTVSRKIHIQ